MKKSATRATGKKLSPTPTASTKSSGRATPAKGPGRIPARELCVQVIHALNAWDDAVCVCKHRQKEDELKLVRKARQAAHELFDRVVKIPAHII